MPFSTRSLIDLHSSRTALLAYSASLVLLGPVLLFGWGYATWAGLVKRDLLIAQSLYAGALLCTVNTYSSIGLSRSSN